MCCKAPGADWGSVIAFIERLQPMADDERHRAVRRSCDLLVASAMQDAIDANACVGANDDASEASDERGGAADALSELCRLLECFGRGHIDAKDHDGSTALHAAALGASTDVMSLLIDARATIDATTTLGETALHFAAREGHLAAVELLVSRGADVTVQTTAGALAQDLAVRRKRREWERVSALLEAHGHTGRRLAVPRVADEDALVGAD